MSITPSARDRRTRETPAVVPPDARFGVGLAILVAVLTLAVFLPALGNGFVDLDDRENFLDNLHYRGLGPAQLRWMFTGTFVGHYIPLTWLTLGLDYLLWGMDPRGYHATSVVLHAANAVLFALVAHRLLAHAMGPRVTPAGLRLGAVSAALLFSLHPLRVESVAWITERRDMVSGLFFLSTVLAYLRAFREGGRGRLHRGWYAAAVVLFGLCLLSKSIAVGLPVVLFALDVYPLRRLSSGTPGRLRRVLELAVLEKAPFFALSAAIAAVTLITGYHEGLVVGLSEARIAQRLAISGYGLAFYLWKSIWPISLAPLYTLYTPVVPLTARYVVPGTAVLLLSGALLLSARRWPAGLVAWVSYVVLLLPVVGVIPNGPQIAADRYTYLACLGGAVLAGAAVAWCGDAVRSGRISRVTRTAGAAAAAVGLGLASLTVLQIGVWRDSITLWRQAATVDPDSDIPIFHLGWALADQRRFDEAREHFARSLRRVPDDLPGLRAHFTFHLGLVEKQAGNWQKAERRFREALALDPKHPMAMIRLGQVLLATGWETEAAQAFEAASRLAASWREYPLRELRAALDEVPADQQVARGQLAFALGVVLSGRGVLEAAEQQYRLAVTLLPRHALAWNNLGVTYAQQGRYPEALEAFLHALEAQPANQEACGNARRAAEIVGTVPRVLAGC